MRTEIEVECGCEEIIPIEVEPGEGPLVGIDETCPSCGASIHDHAWKIYHWSVPTRTSIRGD